MKICNKKNMQKKQGSAIAYALVIIAVVAIILTGVMQFVVGQLKYGYYDTSKQEAFEIAEAGTFYYRWYLAHQTDGKTAQQINTFWQTGSPIGVGTAYEKEYKSPWSGIALGKYRISVTPPIVGSTIITVTVQGWTYRYPDIKRTIKVRFRRPSWSEFSVLGNEYQRFGTGTTVNGKLFSNGGIHFDGIATNTVSSSVSTYYDSDDDVHATKPGVWTSWAGGYNTDMHGNVFSAGTQFPVPVKSFASVAADMKLMHDTSKISGKGFFYAGSKVGWHIMLQGNTFKIREVKTFSTSGTNENDITAYQTTTWTTKDIPDNGVIFVENNVWVEGNINNKKLTIVTGNVDGEGNGGNGAIYNLNIKNDITYTNHDGSDVLGLVSDNNIEIIENSDTNLEIDGALLAVDGRVGRENYGGTRNSITVYGAIATNQRYGFAYTDGTGYQIRNLNYDNNLMYLPPPYFPTGTQYLMDLWEEV
jgi:hypothetical protein